MYGGRGRIMQNASFELVLDAFVLKEFICLSILTMVVLSPSRKRFSVTILDETFKTQKSLIERVKPIFESLDLQKNQRFIQAFVSTYDKVIRQNKELQKVYYGPNECIPSHFKVFSTMAMAC